MGLRERLAANQGGPMDPNPRESLLLLDPALPARLEAFRSKLVPADYAALCRLVLDIDGLSERRTLLACEAEADAVLRHLGHAQGWLAALERWEAAGGVVPPA